MRLVPKYRNPPASSSRTNLRIGVADSGARQLISRLRHDVYAAELRQYEPNQSGRLTDELDEFNQYLCAWSGEELLGFVSITPPGHGRYSVDKYVARERLPFPVDARRARYEETHQLRLALHHQLAGLGWRVVPGCANFLLACLPVDGPGAQQVVEQCQVHGLFLRNAANMGPRLGHRSIRIAVKDRETNARMLSILRKVLVGAPVASGLSLEPVA